MPPNFPVRFRPSDLIQFGYDKKVAQLRSLLPLSVFFPSHFWFVPLVWPIIQLIKFISLRLELLRNHFFQVLIEFTNVQAMFRVKVLNTHPI